MRPMSKGYEEILVNYPLIIDTIFKRIPNVSFVTPCYKVYYWNDEIKTLKPRSKYSISHTQDLRENIPRMTNVFSRDKIFQNFQK